VMDLYNGEIVAYEMASRPCYSLVGNMLGKALGCLGEKPKLVLHSDQGWHYQQAQYRRVLSERGVKQSMSRRVIAWTTRRWKASSARSNPSFST